MENQIENKAVESAKDEKSHSVVMRAFADELTFEATENHLKEKVLGENLTLKSAKDLMKKLKDVKRPAGSWLEIISPVGSEDSEDAEGAEGAEGAEDKKEPEEKATDKKKGK